MGPRPPARALRLKSILEVAPRAIAGIIQPELRFWPINFCGKPLASIQFKTSCAYFCFGGFGLVIDERLRVAYQRSARILVSERMQNSDLKITEQILDLIR